MSIPTIKLSTDLCGIITCIKSDSYGNKIAAGNSEGKIFIYEQKDGKETISKSFQAHINGIFGLSWSNSKYGNYLASCGTDLCLKIWKETSPGDFECVYNFFFCNDSNQQMKAEEYLTKCEFCPDDYGLILCCSSMDGSISIHYLKLSTNEWIGHIHNNIHQSGVLSFSWGPSVPPISFENDFNNLYQNDNKFPDKMIMPLRLVTCGGDGHLKFFNVKSHDQLELENEVNIDYPQSKPIDVDWMKSKSYIDDYAAVCCSDKKIRILENQNQNWVEIYTIDLKEDGSRVFWSNNGSYLGITTISNKTRIFQSDINNEWKEISEEKRENIKNAFGFIVDKKMKNFSSGKSKPQGYNFGGMNETNMNQGYQQPDLFGQNMKGIGSPNMMQPNQQQNLWGGGSMSGNNMFKSNQPQSAPGVLFSLGS